MLLTGFDDPNAIGLELNFQAAVVLLPRLTDVLTNPMTVYVVQ